MKSRVRGKALRNGVSPAIEHSLTTLNSGVDQPSARLQYNSTCSQVRPLRAASDLDLRFGSVFT